MSNEDSSRLTAAMIRLRFIVLAIQNPGLMSHLRHRPRSLSKSCPGCICPCSGTSSAYRIRDPFRNDSVWANDKGHDSSNSILSGGRGESESANHGSANHEIHLCHRCRRSLSLQHLEEVAVIRLTLLRVALLALWLFLLQPDLPTSRLGFCHARPSCFPGVLIILCAYWFTFEPSCFSIGIFVLRVDKTTTNLNRIQFVRANAPIQYFLTTCFRIKKPFPFCFTIGIGRGKSSFPTERMARFGSFLSSQPHFFLCLGCKLGRPFFVLNRILGTDEILAVGTKNFLYGGASKSVAA